MSDNDFTILDEEEKKEQRDGGTEKEKSQVQFHIVERRGFYETDISGSDT